MYGHTPAFRDNPVIDDGWQEVILVEKRVTAVLDFGAVGFAPQVGVG